MVERDTRSCDFRAERTDQSATTASASTSISHSGFTNRVTCIIVSTGLDSRQYLARTSTADFQSSMSVKISRVRMTSCQPEPARASASPIISKHRSVCFVTSPTPDGITIGVDRRRAADRNVRTHAHGAREADDIFHRIAVEHELALHSDPLFDCADRSLGQCAGLRELGHARKIDAKVEPRARRTYGPRTSIR